MRNVNFMLEKPHTTFESVILVQSGEDYFSRLERIIEEAESEIHMQTYIFEYDAIGIRIGEALKNAASRNVKVYLLIDGFGSKSLPQKFIEELESYGINVRIFSPLFSANSFYIGRRLHQKVIVADADTALIGGINIAEKYRGTHTEAPWLDYAIQLKNPDLGQQLQKICQSIYFKERSLRRKKIPTVLFTSEGTKVEILQNDWLKRKNEVYKAYIKHIRYAKNEVIIVGSYFLPGRKLIGAVKRASQNKAKVKIILSGNSDIPLLRHASNYFYTKILHYDIELYEWNQSVLHGKAAVIDSQWTTIGSFNLNNLSSYASIELNVGVDSAEFSQNYRAHLNEILEQCHLITPKSLATRHYFGSKLINWSCYQLVRLIMLLITYLPYKRFLSLKMK